MKTNLENFSVAVLKLLKKNNLTAETPFDCYTVFITNFYVKSKWADLAVFLNVTPRQAHDYFYNMWA
jgi:hypothetical protein